MLLYCLFRNVVVGFPSTLSNVSFAGQQVSGVVDAMREAEYVRLAVHVCAHLLDLVVVAPVCLVMMDTQTIPEIAE